MKKLISVLITTALLLTMFSVTAYAYLDFEFADKGSIGDYEERPEFAYNDPKNGTNLTYEFDSDTGTLTLTHHPDIDLSGNMAPYDTSPFDSNKDIKHLIVNEGVTGFCKGAFRNCTELEDISLPSTMLEISEDAFLNCSSLKSVEFKGSLKTIGDFAFYDCPSLEKVTLNDGLETLGHNCFEDCTALREIIIPKSVTEIFSSAFSGSGLKSLTVKDSKCIIYPYAFNYCLSLTDVDLGAYAELRSNSFSCCQALKSVKIPGVNENVEKNTFYGCISLETLKICEGVTEIQDDAFNDCEAVRTVELPVSLKKIDAYTFRECESLTDVYYNGSKAQWDKIEIGAQNEKLTGAKLHFNSSAPTQSCGGNHKWNGGKVTKKATPTSTGVKTYTCTLCGEVKTETIAKCGKYANPIIVKGKTVTVKLKSLKKKTQTIAQKNAFKITKAQGKVTYTKSGGEKKITVSKSGKLTVKKGLKKGSYKVKVKVKAAGNKSYKPSSKTATVTIKIK